MELIIEEISRGKKIKGRHKFFTEEVSIGRGYHNDLILNDRHVCSDHILIRCVDEQWQAKDVDSLNGSQLGKNENLSDWVDINSGDIISLGKSQLRFILPSHPIDASVKFSALENIIDYLGRWSFIVSMLVLFTAISVLSFYLNTPTKEVNYNSLFLSGVATTVIYAIWPLLCSLMAHLNKHDTRVGAQLGVTFVILNVFWLVDFFDLLFGFNMSSNWSLHWLIALLGFVLTLMMFWMNFYIAFEQSAERRLKIALGLTVFIFAGLFIYDLSNEPDFKTYPEYNSTIMTPNFLFASPSSSAEFNANSDKLFERVTKAAKED